MSPGSEENSTDSMLALQPGMATASAVTAASGLTIRIETPEAFVADLLDGGVIEVIADDAE